MRARLFIVAMLIALLIAGDPIAVHAQATPGPPRGTGLEVQSKLLSLWLAELSEINGRSRQWSAVTSFMGAASFGFLGGLSISLLDDPGSRGERAAGVVVSGLVLGASIGYLCSGIADLVTVSTDEERYQRWQALSSPDEIAVAHFEAELEAEARASRFRRLTTVGASTGLAAVGGVVLVLTPTQNVTDDGRVALYVIGGATLALGAWAVISQLVFESSNERAYRMYRAGKAPDVDHSKPRITPQVSPYGAGVGISARF